MSFLVHAPNFFHALQFPFRTIFYTKIKIEIGETTLLVESRGDLASKTSIDGLSLFLSLVKERIDVYKGAQFVTDVGLDPLFAQSFLHCV